MLGRRSFPWAVLTEAVSVFARAFVSFRDSLEPEQPALIKSNKPNTINNIRFFFMFRSLPAAKSADIYVFSLSSSLSYQFKMPSSAVYSSVRFSSLFFCIKKRKTSFPSSDFVILSALPATLVV